MWNRLEGILRNENQIEHALRFEIRDPLWMLTRQWQFGEFEGEDAGTAAFARIETVQEQIGLAGRKEAPPQAFDIREKPFEMAVEFENREPDFTIRLEMGRQWRRMLKKRLAPEKAEEVWRQFRQNQRFQFPRPAGGDAVYGFRHAQTLSDERLLQSLELLQRGRAMDGHVLYRELKLGVRASLFLAAPDEEVDAIGQAFVDWYEKTYGQNTVRSNTWHDQHIEYQPQFAVRSENGSTQVLRKEEYFGDGIEWHGFLTADRWGPQQEATLPESDNAPQVATVIPTPVRFRGMPSTRLWEMEDAQVDFGSIRAASTELSKMLYAEFGLVYGNDWLLAPVRLPAGQLCRVTGLRVTDIFGKTTILEEIKGDDNWSFMQTADAGGRVGWLFTAPGPETVQESQPIEKVVFMRDEMANLVWAIEEIIPDPAGGGRDGGKAARLLEQWLKGLIPDIREDLQEGKTAETWIYQAGRHVAENRIPFIPVAQQANADQLFGKRQVILQRAALPRILQDFPPVRVRPRTTLLGAGSGDEPERLPPFYIFEEEIPRAGTVLQLVWKRTRWFDGSAKVWLARKKATGRGETDALFKFDTLKNPNAFPD